MDLKFSTIKSNFITNFKYLLLVKMKNLILTFLAAFFLLISCKNESIVKYKKETLPDNFSYKIIQDNSDIIIEKNQLAIEINQKLTEGQIATLAEKLFNSKKKQRRFYIAYLLEGMKYGSGAWATSHYDPELDIQILGSSLIEDENMAKISMEQIDGEVIGKWKEDLYNSYIYIIFKKENKYYLKTIYKNGQTVINELLELKVQKTTKYLYKNGGYDREYFQLNFEGNLELYDKENIKFFTALKVQ